MAKRVSDIISQAKGLIKLPQNWTTGTEATDEYGRNISPVDPQACKFCATGSIVAVTGDRAVASPVLELLDEVAREKYGTGIISLNDSGTLEQVHEVFDAAVDKAHAQDQDALYQAREALINAEQVIASIVA